MSTRAHILPGFMIALTCLALLAPAAFGQPKNKLMASKTAKAGSAEAAAKAPPELSPADLERRAIKVAEFKDGGAVTVGDLEDAIARQSPLMRKRFTDPAEMKQLLDKTTRFMLLAEEAERRGFGNHENVVQTVNQNAVQQLMRKDFDENLPKDAVSDEEVAAYYQEHLSEYQRPATRRASHILVGTLEEAKALLPKAKEADMREFRTLAREHSIDEANKLRGGDLQYFDSEGRAQPSGEQVVPPAIAKAAGTLKNTGDTVATPVKVDGGYSVLRLTGERPAISRKQAEVADSIRTRLWRARRQDAIDAFVKKLNEQHKPELHVELIELVKVETGRSGSAHGMPEGFPEHKPGDAPVAPAQAPAEEHAH